MLPGEVSAKGDLCSDCEKKPDVAGRGFHNGRFVQRLREKAASLSKYSLGFHNGRFVQLLREKAASLSNVQMEQGTVMSLLEDNGKIKAVLYKTKDVNHSGCEEIKTYKLTRGNLSVTFTNYGAVMTSLLLPDRHGKQDDVVLGFDSIESYKSHITYFGAIVGRVANRIGGAKFELNGHVYKTDPNEGQNTLHGGSKGFSDVIWSVHKLECECS